MIKIGVTGHKGFIGTHLSNTIELNPNKFELIDFNNDFFENESLMDLFVEKCDVIVHLAALNRHNDPDKIYKTSCPIFFML